MSGEKSSTERILGLLRPYASNWSGTLSRGDLVIPQRDIPRLVQDILESLQRENLGRAEVSEREVFQALMETRSVSSVQDQATELRRRFHISRR